jgi:hypothetical protein
MSPPPQIHMLKSYTPPNTMLLRGGALQGWGEYEILMIWISALIKLTLES